MSTKLRESKPGSGTLAGYPAVQPKGIRLFGSLREDLRNGVEFQKIGALCSIVENIGTLGKERARELLGIALRDEERCVRIGAILALRDIGIAALPELGSVIKEGDPEEQMLALGGVRKVVTSNVAAWGLLDSTIETLLEATRSDHKETSLAAMEVLYSIALERPALILFELPTVEGDGLVQGIRNTAAYALARAAAFETEELTA